MNVELQSWKHDCPITYETTLNDMGNIPSIKLIHHELTVEYVTNYKIIIHSKLQTNLCVFMNFTFHVEILYCITVSSLY